MKPDCKKTIAVTGGTGHLGINLIKALLKQGFVVRALIRHSSYPVIHPNLSWFKGDLNDLKSLSRLTDQSDAIIHCASAISVGEKDHNLVYDVNIKGTENLLIACLNKPIRFIHISSSTATEDTLTDEVFDETRPYRRDKTFYYAWTKAQGELKVLDKVANNDLDAVILRPTAIIGPEDPEPSRFGRTILDLYHGNLPCITEGGYNMVDVRDLSQTIINSISMGIMGEIYLTGGEYVSLKDLAEMTHTTKRPSILPLKLLIAIVPLINLYQKFFKLKWPVNRESLNALKHAPRKMDCSKARHSLDHTNRAVENSIEDLIRWFEKNNLS